MNDADYELSSSSLDKCKRIQFTVNSVIKLLGTGILNTKASRADLKNIQRMPKDFF